MNADQKELIEGVVANEGFDYAFMEHSSFEEVEDPHFHKLLQEWETARRRFRDYLEAQGVEIDG